MISSNSVMIKLKELAQQNFLFVQMSVSGFVACFVVAVASLFSLDAVKAARIVDLMISVTAGVGVGGAKRIYHTSSAPWSRKQYCI